MELVLILVFKKKNCILEGVPWHPHWIHPWNQDYIGAHCSSLPGPDFVISIFISFKTQVELYY
jgi:hypothetical protein